jgi:hypothetical protein
MSRLRQNRSVKPSAIEKTEELGHSKTVLSHRRGVDVSISDERGETRRYQAQSVTLQIVRGGLEILNDHRGCYAWFEHCRLEARAGRQRLVLSFASGVVSSRGAKLTIVVASVPPSPFLQKFPGAASPPEPAKNSNQLKSKPS